MSDIKYLHLRMAIEYNRVFDKEHISWTVKEHPNNELINRAITKGNIKRPKRIYRKLLHKLFIPA